MDYLNKQRFIPKNQLHKSDAEIMHEIDAKNCGTCIHYDFYYCNALKIDTAPQKSCVDPKTYCSTKMMHSSEEGASIQE